MEWARFSGAIQRGHTAVTLVVFNSHLIELDLTPSFVKLDDAQIKRVLLKRHRPAIYVHDPRLIQICIQQIHKRVDAGIKILSCKLKVAQP